MALEERAEAMMVKESRGWKCFHCGYHSKSQGAKTDVRRHILSKHIKKQFQCSVCVKQFHTNKLWYGHMVTCHGKSFEM